MRTLLLSMLLMAAPANAEPAHDAPGSIHIDITELTISGGGGVDPTVMRRAFDDTLDAASRCYDNVKAKPAKLRATVTLKLRIDNHGAVAKASVVGLPSIHSCLTTAIKALVFDTPDKGALDVTAKLSFSTPATAILGSTAVQQGGAFASLTGTGDVSSGFDDTNIFGGLLGSEAGEMNGGFGYGRAGSGPGGGGWGTIGIGRVGRITDGDPSAPTDKHVIRAHVRKNLAKLQPCYQQALVADPQLAGTATVKFRIAPDGKVSSATGSGLAKVDECVAKAIAAIAFPRPSSGGAIDVSYPFVFKTDADGGRGAPGSGPTVSIGQPNSQGNLDRAIIRRYIKRNLQRIQYCYEMQLLGTPGITGTVQVQFTIGVDGKVTTATGSGVDGAVASCIVDVIQQIEFPKPKDNGVVVVSYPFVFHPGNDGKKP